ncbi:hypothetical protein BGW36DRAFT_372459 [Talaromyces proteolyticus]|uniref:WW domain-containing protein n=1 Tax=Talaromyces proteolyticus TaxID=1131652 RepID=A0AAD4Q416_9EURO|nr:uncharacterized protein BGW36DRAFT_372459 [Talaromyces proteolyticus]KAH8702232.1 hypothetical protein BGW36DRAFT_372459 [Talaromyces proteolyticus]
MSEGAASSDSTNRPATTTTTTTMPPAHSHAGPEEGERENGERKQKGDGVGNVDRDEEKEEEEEEEEEGELSAAPPLPDEPLPPLPDEAPPGDSEDDGWEPVWDGNAQAYYFYNRVTGVSQWENPRVPDDASGTRKQKEPIRGTDTSTSTGTVTGTGTGTLGGYNPAIHGDYDPTAPYAQQYEQDPQAAGAGSTEDASQLYAATGAFNRFTGKWQDTSLTPENYNDENKSRRQMNAYFDVDAAANSHNGRSLKAERSGKKLTKAEVKAFREKRRERKEEKRRAWLRD